MILAWLERACAQGVRLKRACVVLGLDARTIQRWRAQGPLGGEDRRRGPLTRPGNALTDKEKQQVLSICHREEFRDASPNTIVARLADRGTYLASESSFFRILREYRELRPRGRAKPPQRRPVATHTAHGANQVWSWDITYLPTVVRGRYLYLYLVMDVWSRRIMGWSVHEAESSEAAARLMSQALRSRECAQRSAHIACRQRRSHEGCDDVGHLAETRRDAQLFATRRERR